MRAEIAGQVVTVMQAEQGADAQRDRELHRNQHKEEFPEQATE
ncbi:MAG: hypothetical protein QM776_07565 [Rhodocyclaceae bacterium]